MSSRALAYLWCYSRDIGIISVAHDMSLTIDWQPKLRMKGTWTERATQKHGFKMTSLNGLKLTVLHDVTGTEDGCIRVTSLLDIQASRAPLSHLVHAARMAWPLHDAAS